MRHGVVTKVNFQVKSSQELQSLSKYHWTECAKMTFLAFAEEGSGQAAWGRGLDWH